MKKSIIAIVAVYFTWFLMDWVIHGKLLMGIYEATSHLWRPEEEMNMGYMIGITLALSTLFVVIYNALISSKSQAAGLKYGVLLGLIMGVAGGFGPYCWMPIPFTLAIGWFAATLVEFAVAGLIVGALVRE